MATRALRLYEHGTRRAFTITSGQTCTVGKTVIFGTTDTEVQDAGAASDLAIGVCMPHPKAVAGVITGSTLSTGETVEVALFGSVVVPMLVGTGDTTRGKKQKVVANGITDAPTSGGGTTAVELVGVALQSGVAGDLVGVMLAVSSRATT